MAKEFLEVGNLLGTTIIDKEEIALKRMTRSLKKERKALINEATN